MRAAARTGLGWCVALVVAGCSSTETATPVGSGNGLCTAEELREPTAAVTYYVAMEEPGADNDACDGLAPTDEGGGHCPFKDFTSAATRSILADTSDVRLEVRTGHYRVQGWAGIQVSGIGTSDDERVILSAFPGEAPALDVSQPDGASCTTEHGGHLRVGGRG
jgi:hypothetical protein